MAKRIRSTVNHDRLAAWVEHMKGVYQRTIDAHAASGRMDGGDILKVRNHLECLSMIQGLLREHHEMADGAVRDFGHVALGLETVASLIKPNGEIIHMPRRRRDEP